MMKFKSGTLPRYYKDRIKYLYRFQELLRLFHNQKGKDFRDGKITEEEFRTFQEGWFKKRNLLICRELNKCKQSMQEFKAIKKLSLDERCSTDAPYKEAQKDSTIHIEITDIEEK